MNEQPPKDPYEGLTKEQIEIYEAYMAEHPERVIPAEELKDYKEKATALEESITQFEKDFNLEKLFAITNLAPEDAPNHPIREPVRKALVPIVSDLNFLKKESNIPKDIYDALEQRYKNISRAVGMINNGVVDHARG